jgi:hypothetical protein
MDDELRLPASKKLAGKNFSCGQRFVFTCDILDQSYIPVN